MRRTFALRLALAAIATLASASLAARAEAGGRSHAAQRAAYAPTAPRNDVVAEAARWLGSANPTGSVGPWCADFVSFVLRRVGRPPLSSRLAASAFRYGPRLATPRAGALVVLTTRRGLATHVGFLEAIEPDGSLRMISGNWGRRVARAIVPRGAAAFVAVE